MSSKSIWIPIARTDDPVPRHGKAVEVQGEHLALFTVEGRFYVTSNVCTHQFALLTDGYVEDDCVDCPMHQGRFHIPTGEVRGGPVSKCLRTYPVRIDGNDICVEFSAA